MTWPIRVEVFEPKLSNPPDSEPDNMNTSAPAPAGDTTVNPWIVTDDTRQLFEFINTVFGGQELARVTLEDGSIGHAEIRVGDTTLLAFDRRAGWPETPSLLRIFVQDADATIERAVNAGARVVTKAATHAFGHRVGRIRDPLGNLWWITAVVEDVSFEEVKRRLPEPIYAQAMRDAQTTLGRELSEPGRLTPPLTHQRGRSEAMPRWR
jgi:PhnB protein